MLFYLTCEADLNFPFPDTNSLLLQLNAMSDGVKPVTTNAIALASGNETPMVEDVLRRAANRGLVRRIPDQGWIPIAKEWNTMA
jgi:hypothetical protein